MKRFFYSAVLFAVCSTEAMAGGLVTNSNQSASFLRNPARDAVIDIDGVYTNPAGVCFMPNGFHLGLTGQHPEQQRIATTTFQPLALNQNYLGEATRTYKGQASAPIVPSFQAAYVMDKWTVSASFAVGGGGGKCTFDKGIGSLECLVATMPSQLAKQNNMPIGTYTYTLNSYMKGRQYYFGFQVGAGYKINENLSVFGGLRTVFGNASYTGYVKNIKYTSVDQTATAPYTAAIINGINAQVADMEMTTDQSCVGYTPVISVDYRLNDQWNFAAKYEFRTKMNLENSSEMNEAAREQKALDKFNDKVNKYVRDDIPGTLTLGVQYSPIETVRLNAGYHFYDDCNAVKYNNEQDLIDGGTREVLFGAEWDATKLLTVSAGWQNTHYDLSDAYMSDLVHNLSSNMIVLGVRLHVTEKISVDLGYMHNFYDKRTVNTVAGQVEKTSPTGEIVKVDLVKTDVYERKNDAFAVGVNFDF